MLAMISQPMNGISESEIYETWDEASKVLSKQGYEIENTYIKPNENLRHEYWKNGEKYSPYPADTKNIPLYLLSKSIEKMSKCDAVYFVTGWENARGCQIEHEIAEKYGLKILYERSPNDV